ncbi:MAG: UDP-2,3-diacylglucosamine diphosphatase LpxI [Myxococcota bacterium]
MRGRDPVSRLGLIAGRGRLPLLAARGLAAAGVAVRAVGLEGLCDPELAEAVDEIRWHRLGRLDDAAESLRAMEVDRLVVAGAVPKQTLFDGSVRVDLDASAKALLATIDRWDDGTLLRAVAGWLEGQGFRVVRQDEAFATFVAREGVFSGREPSAEELIDAEVGRRALARIGAAGIGQCVVVRRGCVVAVEAVEGTDATIRRAGSLAGPGAVVVKAARPGQDRRFDLPAVGPGTIAAMVEAGARCLAVEAGVTLILDREAARDAADRAGIAWIAFSPDRVGP